MASEAPTRRRSKETKAKPLTFRYTARAAGGRTAKGTVKAPSEVAAQNLLVEQGYTPLTLEPVASQWSLEGALPSMFGIKQADIIQFSNQLATLLESGLTLLPALQLLESQAVGSAAFGRVIRSIAQDLGTGKSFAQAISRHPSAFSEIYVRTIAVGERTGKMESVLREMAEYMEKQAAFSKKVGKALMYPAVVFTVGIGATLVILTVALPPMTNMFVAMELDLPTPTRILMATSNFLVNFYIYIIAVVGTLIGAFIWYTRRPAGRRMLDQVKLSAPLIGVPVRMSELARICRTMAVLLNAGLPLQEVMELLPQTTTNSVVKDALAQVKAGLFLGQGLTYPMSMNSLFPPLMLQMVRVGEESNNLEKNLFVLAIFYETTADERTAAMLSMIAPLSTMFLAGLVGFIAMSVIMPMYSMTGNF